VVLDALGQAPAIKQLCSLKGKSIINPKRSIIHPLKQLTSTNMTPLATLLHRLDAGLDAEQEQDLGINRRRLLWVEEPVSGRIRREESIHEKCRSAPRARGQPPPSARAPKTARQRYQGPSRVL
jgi:hypothetical protein